jgi:hypothetical protein
MNKKMNKVIKLFKESGLEDTEKIELDNLTRAKLVYDEQHNVVVENEYGTQFPVDDLSIGELNVFIYVLNN